MTAERAVRRHVEHCMGTVFSFDVRAPGVPASVIEDAVALLHDIDSRFSTYRSDSAVSRLARGESTVAEADSELRWVLQECEQWTARTGGWFSAYPAGVLDPSGYVKGWAIQRASDLLAAAGSTAHSVNGGGDVRTVGSAAPGQPWRVGIADPNRAGRLITVIAGSDCAVATSGVAERGQHILDPHTARAPVSDIVSLTVTGRDLIECDVLATAAFAMGEAAQDWLGNWAGVNAFAVRADGSTWSTFPGPTDTTVAQVTPT